MIDRLTKHGLSNEQFSGMKVRPHEIMGNMMDVPGAIYANLSSWRSLVLLYPEDGDAMFRYLLYMYDQDTPMLKLFPDMVERRRVAYDLSGLHNKNMQKLLVSGTNKGFQRAVFDYLKAQKSALWALIMVNESMFYECMENMMQDTVMEKDKDLLASLKIKGELAEHMEKTQRRLQKYIKEFYNEDAVLVSAHNTVSTRMSSESIAEQISRNHGA